NVIPSFDDPDVAIKNRVVILPYISVWKKGYPKDEEEQKIKHHFKPDPNFEYHIPALAPAFMWILVQFYKKYADQGLVMPEIVLKHVNEYWKSTDIYSQFISDCITLDDGSELSLTKIYNAFKDWFRDTNPSVKVPERQLLRTDLIARLGLMENGGWKGMRLNENDTREKTLKF
ncbi:D5 family NTPase, partial [mine drainage metagenome]